MPIERLHYESNIYQRQLNLAICQKKKINLAIILFMYSKFNAYEVNYELIISSIW